MLDLNNCVATNVVLTTAIYVKPGLNLNRRKLQEKIFSKPFSTYARQTSTNLKT